jgi:hypothetical protein
MNAFARPEEANPYEFPEFPKSEDQVTEYANVEGAVDYSLRDFSTAEAFNPSSDSAPVVQPAVFQDFKEAFSAAQA